MLPATLGTLVLATLPVACYTQLVPDSFQAPKTYVAKTYKLAPLGPGSEKQCYDATATIWVTKAMYDAGFEATLVKDMKAWLSKAWPFQSVARPKRETAAEDWKKLPDKPKK